MSRMYQLFVQDETGQKQDRFTTEGHTPWAEVTARSVEQLGLPTHIGDQPVIYHCYDDDCGEALLPGLTVAETVREVELIFRVRVASEMQPA